MLRRYGPAALALLVATVSVVGRWADVYLSDGGHVTVSGVSRGGWIVWLCVVAGCVVMVGGKRGFAAGCALVAAVIAATIVYQQGDALLNEYGGLRAEAAWGALTVFLAPALLVWAALSREADVD